MNTRRLLLHCRHHRVCGGRTGRAFRGADRRSGETAAHADFGRSGEDAASLCEDDQQRPGNEYEGVWLHEILKRAGVPSGGELRGKALTSYLLVEAKDGYQVLFSLAEIDPAFTENQVLLADKADGKPLVGSQGPFRLVAAKDKPGARSIRMVTKIEVVQLRK